MPTRILQLTDLHLLADSGGRANGVPTRDAFRDVIRFINTSGADYDAVVLTGDLAQDEVLDTYNVVRDMLGTWTSRCRIIPGNHDLRDGIRQVFPELVPADGPITFSLSIGGWQLIGLDSHVPGETTGRIDSPQLRWLGKQLAETEHQPTILFIHHPPFSVNSAWMDSMGLVDSGPVLELIRSSPQVQMVCAGHVHMEFAGQVGHTRVLTTPSTAFQFDPNANEPVFDSLPPGFRVIYLDGDSCTSEVVRLPEQRYPPLGRTPS